MERQSALRAWTAESQSDRCTDLIWTKSLRTLLIWVVFAAVAVGAIATPSEGLAFTFSLLAPSLFAASVPLAMVLSSTEDRVFWASFAAFGFALLIEGNMGHFIWNWSVLSTASVFVIKSAVTILIAAYVCRAIYVLKERAKDKGNA